MYPSLMQKVFDLLSWKKNAQSILDSLLDRIYPVGSIYMSMNSTNPATLLGGGVWEALPTGRVLVGAGTGYTAGGTGGNKTVTLTVAQLPSHSHANTLAAAGGHSHTRGSMEIKGTISAYWRSNMPFWNSNNAFTPTSYDGEKATSAYTDKYNNDSQTFTASRTWAGSTNTVANHNHTITNASTGGGSAVNIEQPWLAVYMWKRTA